MVYLLIIWWIIIIIELIFIDLLCFIINVQLCWFIIIIELVIYWFIRFFIDSFGSFQDYWLLLNSVYYSLNWLLLNWLLLLLGYLSAEYFPRTFPGPLFWSWCYRGAPVRNLVRAGMCPKTVEIGEHNLGDLLFSS